VSKESEHSHQKALFCWAALYDQLKWMHSVPNGAVLAGNKSKRAIQMNGLKSTGLKPGVWDVFLPVAKHGYHGLYIEMKAGKNKLSDNQKEFGQFVHEQGYLTHTCFSATEAIDVIKNYMSIN